MSRNRQDLPELATDEQTISSNLACVASVSARVRRESWDKSQKEEWKGRGRGEKQLTFPLSLTHLERVWIGLTDNCKANRLKFNWQLTKDLLIVLYFPRKPFLRPSNCIIPPFSSNNVINCAFIWVILAAGRVTVIFQSITDKNWSTPVKNHV